jgi:signal transduction histidine kinase
MKRQHKFTKNKKFKLFVVIIVLSFLCQNIAWANNKVPFQHERNGYTLSYQSMINQVARESNIISLILAIYNMHGFREGGISAKKANSIEQIKKKLKRQYTGIVENIEDVFIEEGLIYIRYRLNNKSLLFRLARGKSKGDKYKVVYEYRLIRSGYSLQIVEKCVVLSLEISSLKFLDLNLILHKIHHFLANITSKIKKRLEPLIRSKRKILTEEPKSILEFLDNRITQFEIADRTGIKRRFVAERKIDDATGKYLIEITSRPKKAGVKLMFVYNRVTKSLRVARNSKMGKWKDKGLYSKIIKIMSEEAMFVRTLVANKETLYTLAKLILKIYPTILPQIPNNKLGLSLPEIQAIAHDILSYGSYEEFKAHYTDNTERNFKLVYAVIEEASIQTKNGFSELVSQTLLACTRGNKFVHDFKHLNMDSYRVPDMFFNKLEAMRKAFGQEDWDAALNTADTILEIIEKERFSSIYSIAIDILKREAENTRKHAKSAILQEGNSQKQQYRSNSHSAANNNIGTNSEKLLRQGLHDINNLLMMVSEVEEIVESNLTLFLPRIRAFLNTDEGIADYLPNLIGRILELSKQLSRYVPNDGTVLSENLLKEFIQLSIQFSNLVDYLFNTKSSDMDSFKRINGKSIMRAKYISEKMRWMPSILKEAFSEIPDSESIRTDVAAYFEKLLTEEAQIYDFNISCSGFNRNIGMVDLNPIHMWRTVKNLFKNTREALYRKHGEILASINIDVEKQVAVISITDNAGGISPDIKDDIFKEGVTTKRNEYGTHGLGLSSVKNMLERAGGSISYTSVEGKGTTFIITLPIMVLQSDMLPPALPINPDGINKGVSRKIDASA